MKTALYSFACAAFAATVSLASAAGCVSDRVAGPDPGQNVNLCEGSRANVVQIRNFAFNPAVLTVSAGTEVTFVNCDPDTHSSASDTGVWDSNLLPTGTSFKRTFSTAGTFAYHCNPHPSMQASSVVQ